jgi:rod shape determining protein RodA
MVATLEVLGTPDAPAELDDLRAMLRTDSALRGADIEPRLTSPRAGALGPVLSALEIAVGSGGIIGQGFMHGRLTNLNFVPEQHTDFIFTVAGEEFGFVGSMFVLALFAILLWRAIRISFLSKDAFGTYVAAGIAAMFAIQMFVNVGMVIGIMPITGIPLPFVSYGGSSMLANFIAVGLLLNIHMRRFT